MATFLVLNPPGRVGKDEEARIIKDGFSLFGLVFPMLFLLWHRLWLASAILFAASVMASVLAEGWGISVLPFALWMTGALYVGLEGNNLRIRALTARGWDLVDIVMADNLGDAEALYFSENEDPDGPAVDKALPQWSVGRTGQRRLGDGPALGLFDPYGGR